MSESPAPPHAKSYKRPKKVLLLDRETCISCAGCVGTCPEQALDMFSLDLQVFQDKCTYCTICVRFCPVGALSIEKREPEPADNLVLTPRQVDGHALADRPMVPKGFGASTL
jgi:ferredoxin